MSYNIGPTIAVNGEKEFANAMKNIRSEMKQVQAAANAATSAYDKNDKSIEALTTRQTALKNALSVQEKAVKAAQDALERMKEKGIDPSSKAYLDMVANLNNAEAAYNTTKLEIENLETAIQEQNGALDESSKKLEENRKATEEAAAQEQAYAEACKTVDEELTKFVNGGLAACTAALAGLAAAGVAGIKMLTDMAGASADVADGLLTTSTQLGVSTDFLQEYGYAARFIDTEIGTLTNSMTKNIRSMKAAQDGSKLSVEAYEKLGVAIQNADGSLRDSDTVYWEVIDALGAMTNETERNAITLQLMGKSAMELNPLIKAGSGAVKAYADEARNLGLVMDNETVAALGRYDDALETIDAQMGAVKNTISAQLTPYLETAARSMSEAIAKVTKSLSSGSLKPSLDKIGQAIEKFAVKAAETAQRALPKLATALEWLVDNGKKLLDVLIGATAAFATFKTALLITQTVEKLSGLMAALKLVTAGQTIATEAATAAQMGLNTAMAANPIGLIVTLVAALTAGLVAYGIASGSCVDSTTALNNEIERTAEASAEAQKAHSDTVKALEDERDSTDKLLDRVQELASKTSLTAGEQLEMAGLVEELNSRLQGLNLTYDANTHSLNKNIDSVRKSIQARYEEAKADEYVKRGIALIDERIEKEKQLQAAQDARAEAHKKYIEALRAYNDAMTKYSGDMTMAPLQDAVANLNLLTGEWERACTVFDTAKTSLDETTQAIADNEAELEKVSPAVQGYADTIDEAQSTIVSFTFANIELGEEIAKAGMSAEEAQGKLEGYAAHTQNAFSQIEQQAAISVGTLTENLLSNQEAVRSWAENLNALSGVLDDGFLEKLRTMGPEYAATVQELVNATPEELKGLNEAWQAGGEEAVQAFLLEIGAPEMIESGANTVEEIAASMEQSTKLDEAAVKVVESAADALGTAIEAANFGGFGVSISEGIAEGIESGSGSVASAMEKVVAQALAAAQQASDTHSPSRLFRDKIGAMWGEGIKVGFTDSMAKFAQTVGTVTQNAVNGIKTIPTGGGATVNLTVTDPSPAYMDYLFNKFNVKLGTLL